MKLAMCTKMTTDLDLLQSLRVAGTIGYDGVEIFCIANHLPVNAPADLARQARAIADHYSLSVVTLATYLGGLGGLSEETGASFLAGLRAYLDLAAILGCSLLRVGTVSAPSATADAATWANTGQWLRQACDLAAGYGASLVIETHANQLGDSLSGCQRLLEAAAEAPNLGFTWDAGSMAPDPTVDYGPVAIAALGARILYAQVNDSRRVGDKREYVFTGDGEVDNGLMLRGLRQIGYDGYVGAESHRPADEWYDSRGVAEREHWLMRQLLREAGAA
jgi:sugar phosphate isomerase/epimerase